MAVVRFKTVQQARQLRADGVAIPAAIRGHLSASFVSKWEQEPFLQFGTVVFTRLEMIEVLGCGNFSGATRLMKVLKRLKVTTFSQLNKLDPFSLHRTKGVGDAQLMVAMKLLRYGGYDVDDWWDYHVTPSVKRHKQEV